MVDQSFLCTRRAQNLYQWRELIKVVKNSVSIHVSIESSQNSESKDGNLTHEFDQKHTWLPLSFLQWHHAAPTEANFLADETGYCREEIAANLNSKEDISHLTCGS